MQNATFVSSADHKATRSADGNFPGGFSLFRATLCAQSPRLIIQLLLASLVIGHSSGRAEETEKPASPVATLLMATNAAGVATEISAPATNSLSLSVQLQPVATNSFATTTNRSLSDFSWTAVVIDLEKEDDDTTGLFPDQPGNGHFGFANFQAGYGQAYDSDSIVLRGRNGTAWEEPRYIFVKKVIRF